MSAVNALVYPEGAILFTDGATSEGGVICDIRSKVTQLPQMRAAVAYTGPAHVAWIVESHVGVGARDFDQLAAQIETDVARGVETFRRESGPDFNDQPLDVIAVGFSPSRLAYSGVICGYRPGEGVFSQELFGVFLQPWTPEIAEALTTAHLRPDGIAALPRLQRFEAMLKVMQTQRQEAAKVGEVIGGFQQATILEKDVTFLVVSHPWPEDEIGAQVRPPEIVEQEKHQ